MYSRVMAESRWARAGHASPGDDGDNSASQPPSLTLLLHYSTRLIKPWLYYAAFFCCIQHSNGLHDRIKAEGCRPRAGRGGAGPLRRSSTRVKGARRQGGAALAIQSAYTVIFPPARICRPVTVQIDFFIISGSVALHFFSTCFVKTWFSVGQRRPCPWPPRPPPPPTHRPGPVGGAEERKLVQKKQESWI